MKVTQKRSLVRAFSVWGVWRFALSLWGYVAWRMGLIQSDAGREWLHGIVPAMEGPRAALVDIWLRWDTVHYLRILRSGYGPDERSAFFPVYPLTGKVAASILGGDNLLGLLLVSNLAAIGSFYLIDQLAQAEKLQTDRYPVIVNVVFYPAAFFLIVAYPQSLVLFLSLAAYLAQRRNWLLVSFTFALIAGLTHSTASALAILLFVSALGTEGRRITRFLPAIGPLLGIVMFMLWRDQAGYPSYQALQMTMSSREIGFGIELQGVMSPGVWLLRGWPNLLALFIGIGSILWAYRIRKRDWAAFEAALLVIPILSAPSFEPLDGLARYALLGFPAFFAISDWLPRGWKRLVLFALAVGGNLYLSGLFIMWGFIG